MTTRDSDTTRQIWLDRASARTRTLCFEGQMSNGAWSPVCIVLDYEIGLKIVDQWAKANRGRFRVDELGLPVSRVSVREVALPA